MKKLKHNFFFNIQNNTFSASETKPTFINPVSILPIFICLFSFIATRLFKKKINLHNINLYSYIYMYKYLIVGNVNL